jgi:pyruvate ferredoxin oxidoreductase alpha subunit
MDEARRVFATVDREWKALTGRGYGALELYRTEDAELLLVTSGTITSTSRYVVDALRDAGKPVGLVKVKLFRPFPVRELRAALSQAPRVAVLDRNISPGHGGIFAEEIRSALYDLPDEERPMLFGYVLGLGGRDVTPDVVQGIVEQTWNAPAPEREDIWVGVKP